jgi:hypothetical protein
MDSKQYFAHIFHIVRRIFVKFVTVTSTKIHAVIVSFVKNSEVKAIPYFAVKVKVKFALEQATKATILRGLNTITFTSLMRNHVAFK